VLPVQSSDKTNETDESIQICPKMEKDDDNRKTEVIKDMSRTGIENS
jgi:hypothetical protein